MRMKGSSYVPMHLMKSAQLHHRNGKAVAINAKGQLLLVFLLHDQNSSKSSSLANSLLFSGRTVMPVREEGVAGSVGTGPAFAA